MPLRLLIIYFSYGRRAVAVLLELVEHDVRDVHRRVQADEVEQGQRAHRVATAELHAVVDVLLGGDTGLERADGVEQVRHEQEVDDEAGRVLRLDHDLADLLAEGAGALEDLVRRREGAHDFDQLHERDGVEEVQTHEVLGALRGGGHVTDGQRRGVRREDRVLGADLVERREQLALDLEVLDDRLDDQIAVAHVGELGRERHTAQDGGLVVLGELALGDGLAEELVDLALALGAGGVVHLTHDHVQTRLGGDLGNARAHETATDDADLLDVHSALTSRLS